MNVFALGNKENFSEASPPSALNNIVSIYCGTQIFEKMNKSIHSSPENSIVLQPDSKDACFNESFCADHHIPAKNLIEISPCYFARYMSPFRNGCEQGPCFPPTPVIDKLRIRLYHPNAKNLYTAIKDVIKRINTDFCNIHIYSCATIHNGYFIDCALLAAHALSEFPHLNGHISLTIDAGNYYYWLPSSYTRFLNAVKEEITFVQRINRAFPLYLDIGPYKVSLTESLFHSICYMIDGNKIDIDAIIHETKPLKICGWPYFRECDWNNIDYDGFHANKGVVQQIFAYASADQDGGLHLYSKFYDKWII